MTHYLLGVVALELACAAIFLSGRASDAAAMALAVFLMFWVLTTIFNDSARTFH